MKIPSLRSVSTLLALVALSVSAQAQHLIVFGSSGPAASLFRASGHAAGNIDVSDSETSLRLRSPNFWSLQAQATQLSLDLADAAPGEYLSIEVKGRVHDADPVLRLVLLSADWHAKSEWNFDLSGINNETFTTVKARTPLGAPVKVGDAPPLDLGLPIRNAQILAIASSGNQSWVVELESIKVVAP